MFEAVVPRPIGGSTTARYAVTAHRYGFDGIVVRERPGPVAGPDPSTVADRYGLEVVPAVELRPDGPGAASASLGAVPDDGSLLLLRGGSDRLNRFAVEHDRVDVLGAPLSGDGGFNHVLAREAARNGVRVEIDLGPALRRRGGARVREIARLRDLHRVVDRYDAPYVVSAGPTDHLELRAPRELIALGEVLGFEPEELRAGLAEWGRLAARNRDRRSDGFVEPGVRRGRHGGEPE